MTYTTYPLHLDGPLCPLLDDAELLYAFYDRAGMKQDIKRFIKRQRWPEKPPLSYSLGPPVLKPMLLHLLNSAAGRKRLEREVGRDPQAPLLHNAMWNWLAAEAAVLVELADEHGHHEGEKLYLSPTELGALLDAAQARAEDPVEPARLAILALSFAMIQPDQAEALLTVLVEREADLRQAVGLA